jgi:ketosteroid isomerase-like protein
MRRDLSNGQGYAPAVNEDNVELTRRAFEALAEGGVEAMLPYVDDDFEMYTPPDLAAEPDTYRGHDGVRRWFDTFYEAMDEIRIEPQEIMPVGERVAMSFRMTARGRTTGLEMVQEAAAISTVVESKVTRLEFFPTLDDARAAAAG